MQHYDEVNFPQGNYDRTALVLGDAELIKTYFNNKSFHKSETPGY